MEYMLERLNECLKDSNLETVSKAELRKKYLAKAGLTKLPKEDKSLFTSAVNTAYLNYISAKTKANDIVDNKRSMESSNNEIKENTEDKKLIMDSSSEDEITPANIKEDIIADLYANGVKQSSDSDEKSLASYKNNVIRKSSNDIKKQRSKRTLTSSSEDETIEIKSFKQSKILKKTRKSSDSESKHITKSEKRQKIPKTKYHFKKAVVDSSDSEEEPLTVLEKKSNSFKLKYVTNQSRNRIGSEDEPVMLSTNSIKNSENHFSNSEDEPLTKFQKSNDFMHSNGKTKKFKTKQKSNGSDFDTKSKNNSSNSEDEPLTKYRKCDDSICSDDNSNSFIKKKLNSTNKSFKSIENTSGSEDESVLILTKRKSNLLNKSHVSKNSSSESENESLAKCPKKKVNISVDSDEKPFVNDSLKLLKNFSDSEDESFNNLSNKKADNSNNSEISSKSKEKTLKKEIYIESDDDDSNISNQVQEKSFDGLKNSLPDSSDDEPLSNMIDKESKPNLLNESFISKNSSGSENDSSAKYLKNKVINSVDSDEELITILTENSNHVDGSLNFVENLSDSEDESLSNLNNEVENHSSDSKKKPDEKIVKFKVKHLKNPLTNCNKSKEQILKKKFIDSDDDDSSENEPLSKTKRELKNSFDSEDEPLNTLPSKKLIKRKSSESGSGSFVDENEEHSSKKNKPSKRKDANDSGKQGKKRLSASENKIEHLKKYLRVAGIRIPNYNKLFENCKTMKAKCEKLLSLLEKEGLKGRPTLEKCKKLRKKIETKREIAELDMSNILKIEGGRPKRSVCSITTNCKPEEENVTSVKKFSRLQDIVDSEESD